MSEREGFVVVAVGTSMYDGITPMQIDLLARSVANASSRYIEDDETGDFVIDPTSLIPDTADGNVYYIGATSGGEFRSIADTVAWADKRTWGPVKWTFIKRSPPTT